MYQILKGLHFCHSKKIMHRDLKMSNILVTSDNKVKIASLGGIEAVVKAMEAHVGSAGVQEQGCRAFWNLSFNAADNKVKIVSLGGRQVLLKALETHPTVERVGQFGRQALESIPGC